MYPLGEREVVVGFEAAISGRLLSVEVQSRGKLEDCCLDCCPVPGILEKEWACCGGTSQDIQCSNGETHTLRAASFEVLSYLHMYSHKCKIGKYELDDKISQHCFH